VVLRLDPLVAEVIVDSPDEDGMLADLTTRLPIVATAEALISGQSTTSSSSLKSPTRGHPPLSYEDGLRTDTQPELTADVIAQFHVITMQALLGLQALRVS
jgi:hypothetical protein